MEERSFINPFSIASCKDSDKNSQGEVTAEGFFKNPEDTVKSAVAQSAPPGTSSRDDINGTVLSANSRGAS